MTSVRSAPAPATAARPKPRRNDSSEASWSLLAAAAALLVATWLYAGYRYDSGNTPALLQHVLRFNGDLQGDWYTSLAPAHWAVDHALALVPSSQLEAAVIVCWLASLAVFWLAFLDICRQLGAPVYVGLAAALVLIPTRAGGFGVSEVISDFFYPNLPAFALVLLGIALILRNRMTWAGTALGASIVVHPGVGPLSLMAIGPMALIAMDRRDLRSLLRFAAPIAIIGLVPFAELMLDGISESSLSDHERFEFVALVRQPHHVLYSAFPTYEYVRTGLWFAGLAVSLGVLWRLRAARLLATLTGTILALCAIGAVASEAEGPFLVVNAQTSRLSALIVLLAVAAIAAVLTRALSPLGATLTLVGAFLVAPAAYDALDDLFPSWGTLAATEAVLLLLVLAFAVALIRRSPAEEPWISARSRSLEAAAVGVAFLIASVSMAIEHDARTDRLRDPGEEALKDVAARAEKRTDPGDLVLASPTTDGLRVYARRPTVVEFGFITLGSGDDEWRQRHFDLTGNPDVLDPDAAPASVADRKALIDDGYQRTIQISRFPICEYDAKVVIAKPLSRTPAWLRPVYRNEYFELYDVRPGTCQA